MGEAAKCETHEADRRNQEIVVGQIRLGHDKKKPSTPRGVLGETNTAGRSQD